MNRLKKGIAVVGSTTIDKIISGKRSYLKLGGVTTYAGITYRRQGLPVIIVSNMAKQDEKLMDKLTAEDISVFGEESDLSTYFITHIKGDNRQLELLQRARSIRISQIRSILGKIGGLHLGPLHPLDLDSSVLASLQNSNLKIFLDVQGYTRTIKNRKIHRQVCDQMTAGLSLAHIAKANEAEYHTILSFFGMTLSELMRRFEIEEFVVTMGRGGGFIQKRNGKRFQYQAAKIKTLNDPTGAGDVFLAAYVIHRFVKKTNIPEACLAASEMAARQIEGKYITTDRLWIRENTPTPG
jgi:sugar/nucleoside kinase (ribokinase family)